jgi:hypothetical protein
MRAPYRGYAHDVRSERGNACALQTVVCRGVSRIVGEPAEWPKPTGSWNVSLRRLRVTEAKVKSLRRRIVSTCWRRATCVACQYPGCRFASEENEGGAVEWVHHPDGSGSSTPIQTPTGDAAKKLPCLCGMSRSIRTQRQNGRVQ